MKRLHKHSIYMFVFVFLGLLLVISTTQDRSTEQTDDTSTAPVQTLDVANPKYSLTDPNSLWVVVNKQRPIPTDYIPELAVPDVNLRLEPSAEQMKVDKRIADSIESMFKAAQNDGIILRFGSGYRSADYQQTLHQTYIANQGTSKAEALSARAGHSEHQTGLAFDVVSQDDSCYIEACWADTAEGIWVASKAHNYGFIIRYQKGKESITGYQFEPWHLRYVGIELATDIHKTGHTLEEYFNLPAAPDYN